MNDSHLRYCKTNCEHDVDGMISHAKDCSFYIEEIKITWDEAYKHFIEVYNVFNIVKKNEILKSALEKYVNAIEKHHAIMWHEMFIEFKEALEKIKEINE